ncbi:MAG: amidohydrolase family protein [Cytophagales bacterium]|nr:amidohydrolase family protein [Cytophagales bacterium]
MKARLLLLTLLPFYLFGQSTVIKDVNLLDVEKRKVLKNMSVKITDGKITQMDQLKKMSIDTGDSIIDGTGKYLIPGLMDTHIHFFQSGGIYTRPDALDLTHVFSYEEEIQFAKDNAVDYLKRYLRNGITTVMDVGGPLWNYEVRDSLAENSLSPNVLVTGPLFSMVSRPQLDKGDPPIIQVTTKEEVLQLFNQQLPYRPDFMKVWYVVTPDLPAEKSYPLVAYLGELCRENNLKLAVHATQLETAKLAVKAGANILVHSIDDVLIPQEFISEMKKKQVTYIPTMIVGDGYFKTFTGVMDHHPQDLKWANPAAYNSLLDPNKLDKSAWPERLKVLYGLKRPARLEQQDSIMRVNLRNVFNGGVNVATGTDAGNIGTMHASSYLPELEAMSKSELSIWDLLVSSTINAAKGFSLDARLGSIKVGKEADLVLLGADPLQDLQHLNAIEWVMKGGELLTPDKILVESPAQIVQRQVNAYNARDIDAFLDTYSADVKVYNEKGEMTLKGHAKMRERYGLMFERVTNLYCEIVNRIVINNKVIDQEKVRFNDNSLEAVAIYEVTDGKISKVTFVR